MLEYNENSVEEDGEIMISSNILSVQNITKIVRKKKILADVSFNVQRGHIVGLLGPNGAGKSTIMKCILGIENLNSGQITFETYDSSYFKSKIGALIESPALYPFLTGREHIQLLVKESSLEAIEAIEELGLEKYLDQKVQNYSLGMKQKMGIALAFLDNPALVILDEPMNGLDFISTIQLRNFILKKATQGTTFIICSHVLSELQKIITDLVIINHGKVKFSATLDELKAQYTKYYLIDSTDNKLLAKEALINQISVTNEDNHIKLSNAEQLHSLLVLAISKGVQINNIWKKEFDLENELLKVM